jgi:N-acetylmuramoyl-L-alanine amidase
MGKRGRFFRGRKAIGAMLLLEAMQLLAVMLILIGSMMYVNNKLDKVGFYKIFFGRDIGLMTTAMYGAPGNILQFYDISPPGEAGMADYGFGFSVHGNFVRVNATTAPDQIVYWYFSSYGMYPIRFEESFPPSATLLKFGKEGNSIIMGGAQLPSPKGDILTCPFVDTEESGWLSKKFIFDAAQGENENDKGAVNQADNTFYESKITMAIANRIGSGRMGNKLLTREEGKYAPLNERAEFISGNAGSDTMIISIHAGNSPETGINHVKAYYNMLSDANTRLLSRKLGCEIINSIIYSKDEISGTSTINGVAIIPSDSDYIQGIIPAGKIGVLLELGNVQIPRNNNFLDEKSATELAGAIFDGMYNYHSANYEGVADEG